MSPTASRYIDGPDRRFDYLALTICLMCGTASLPHVLMRYFTTTSVKAARQSVSWSLFFIFLLYVSTPAYAAYARDRVLKDIIAQPLRNLPEWIFKYGDIGMVQVCGKDATNLNAVYDHCTDQVTDGSATADYRLETSNFWINPDAVVIAAPEISNQPYVIAGLVASGGLAAALSTADGLLLAISNTLSHDIYANMIDPFVEQYCTCGGCGASTISFCGKLGWDLSGPDGLKNFRKFVVARTLLIVIAILSAMVAATKPADILSMVAWAFSLACGGQFPALALGIWWKGTTPIGAVAGMMAGFILTLTYLIGTQYSEWELWGEIKNTSSAIFGLPVGFVVTILVSLCTPPSDEKVMQEIDALRQPEQHEEEEEQEQFDEFE